MSDTVQLLQELTELDGPSGYEAPVANYVADCLQGVAEISRDNLGSVIACHQGEGGQPRVMLAGHLDEVGFMVKLVTPEGYVKFTPLGGWWSQVLLAQRVKILTSRGAITGVIGTKPPHLLTEEKRKALPEIRDMFIDVGAASREQATEEFGILPGDPIVPASLFTRMADPDLLLARAWDDRAGVAMMIQALQRLVAEGHPGTLYAAGTVQEEVGLRGAQTAVNTIKPDVALICETAIAGDVPGIEEHESAVKIGGGPVIYILDGSMIPNLRLRDLALSTCRELGFTPQISILERGGTDGGRVHLHAGGVPTLVLGVPTRHIHTHAGIMHLRDYEQSVDLIVALCRKLDAATVAGLTTSAG